MKLLITGSRGHLGSVLCARAIESGHTVYAIDNDSSGLNAIEEIEGLKVLTIDCWDVVNLPPVDAILHMAAASPDGPESEMHTLNYYMPMRLFQSARKLGIKAFLYPAGLAGPHPAAISKEAGLAGLWQLDPQLQMLIPVRLQNIIGAYRGLASHRKTVRGLIPKMVQALTDPPFRVHGADYNTEDGTPARDYIHVVDAADYLLYAVERHLTGSPIPMLGTQQALDVGTGITRTVIEMVEIFRATVSHKLQVVIGKRILNTPDTVKAEHGAHLRAWRQLRDPSIGVQDEGWALLGNVPAPREPAVQETIPWLGEE